jgi:hypothetical protein
MKQRNSTTTTALRSISLGECSQFLQPEREKNKTLGISPFSGYGQLSDQLKYIIDNYLFIITRTLKIKKQ